MKRRELLAALGLGVLHEGCTMKLDENPLRYRPIQGGESVQENVKQIRFGAEKILTPYGGENLDCYGGLLAGSLSRPRMLFPQSLMRVTEQDLQELSYLPGAWALTLDAKPIGDAIGPYPGTLPVSPIMAQLTFGSGAGAFVVEVDAIRNTIILPAMDLSVDVGVSQMLGTTLEGQQVTLFRDYKVTGSIQRVAGSGLTRATRTVICNNGQFILPIPPFANEWCYVTNAALEFEELLGGGARLYYPDREIFATDEPCEGVAEDILSNNSRNHCFREYHPLAKTIGLAIDFLPGESPISAYPGAFVHKLDF